ncbi:MAG: BrnT family toxin [Allorhizobium sp.]
MAYALRDGAQLGMATEELNEFDWDEKKRHANIEKHGIDFEDAILALAEPRIDLTSHRPGEDRFIAICPDKGKLIAVVYTMRGSVCRIISVRAARTNERKEYHAHYPR